jgi:hypothetical protein
MSVKFSITNHEMNVHLFTFNFTKELQAWDRNGLVSGK